METGFELEQVREVTTQELDEAVTALAQARKLYQEASAISDDRHAEVKKLEGKLIELLTYANKTSYIVDKVAQVTVVSKAQVTTPKTLDQKKEFFEWLRQKYGDDGLLAYQTINSNTLNSLYNAEMAKALEKGEEFTVKGLDLPMVVRSLQVRSR
jgi:hypothetical protein